MFTSRQRRRASCALVGILIAAVFVLELTDPNADSVPLSHNCGSGAKFCLRGVLKTALGNNNPALREPKSFKKITWERSGHKFGNFDLSDPSVQLPCCLVGFELNTSATRQYYDFLTHTPLDVVGPYFDAALEFLRDVVANWEQTALQRVVWAMSDDGGLSPDGLNQLSRSGFVILSHSVHHELRWRVSLVPNFHFIQTRGFTKKMHELSLHRKDFKDKQKMVFWRGVSTGIPSSGLESRRCSSLPRVMAVQASQDVPWLDFAITRAVQDCVRHESLLQSLDLFGSHMAERDWLNYRGILEIDGNVDSWGNFWRAASHSVLFKVFSDFVGYFTANMVNGTHFIEIAADLSDLHAKTWMVTSDDPARLAEMSRIAQNSFEYITHQNYTYDSVVKNVGAELFSHLSN